MPRHEFPASSSTYSRKSNNSLSTYFDVPRTGAIKEKSVLKVFEENKMEKEKQKREDDKNEESSDIVVSRSTFSSF